MTCDITICDIEIFNHSNGQDSAAREALEWLRGTNRVDQVLIVVIKIMLRLSICKGYILQEFYQIKRSLDESSQLSAGLGDLVKRWRKFNVGADVHADVDVDVGVDAVMLMLKCFSPNLAPFIISLMLMFGQQLSGMNAVMFYCVDIFQVERITNTVSCHS